MKYKRMFPLFLCCLSLLLAVVSSVQADERRKPVIQEGKTSLPLKVIARPFSNIYKQADEKSPIVEENVPVFQSYYAYTKPEGSALSTETAGWYEVGSDDRGTVLGWMKAADVMEWKQTMCVAYEHPLGRKPVLMFKDIAPLREMIKMPGEERVKKAEEYYTAVNSRPIPADFPIISVEPEGAVDIHKNFYLLPILESAPIEIEGREGRLLKIASAPKSGRGKTELGAQQEEKIAAPEVEQKKGENAVVEGDAETSEAPVSDTVQASDLMVESDLDGGIVFSAEAREKIAADIVFVIDMTNSMQEYIDATVNGIRSMANKITSDPKLSEKMRFGLWGYRDSTTIPGMDFAAKDFTPELQDVQTFIATLDGVQVTPAGSQGYDEDVFSGVEGALTQTNWRQEIPHFVVLVGDAPAHKPGHKWNASGHSADTLRTLADDSKIYINAYHIKDPKAQKYWSLAEQQFRTLSTNKGGEGEAAYMAMTGGEMKAFEQGLLAYVNQLTGIIDKVSKTGKVAPGPQKNEGNSGEIAYNTGYAALVEWLGSQENVEAPRDITAWITDKDLLDPSASSLDVNILINKKQLDSLNKVLTDILISGRKGMISGDKFFNSLQAVVAASGRDASQIQNAKNLAESGLVPEFMSGLPYQSEIMTMNDEIWDSMSIDQQDSFLNNLDAKLKLYTTIHDEPSGWVPLNQGADSDENVYPLSLQSLP